MKRVPILQFGATGQVAREMILRAAAAGADVHALPREACDLTDSTAVARAVLDAPAGTAIVVNAAAYTAVDKAETDRETAMAVNAEAPAAMARACQERGLGFIHLSTDYVFNGDKPTPYVEDDPVAPIGRYGESKLAGEAAVREAHPDAVIIRTSWVFSPWGKNFLRTMMRLACERDELGIVDDQHGSPTPAGEVADAVLRVAAVLAENPQGYGGVYHFSGGEPTTWKQFADAIFAEMTRRGLKVPRVNAITTSQYPTPAARPAHSVLDCTKIGRVFNIQPADWKAALRRDVGMAVQDGDTSS
ncbi:dTDP-4-dehydrorhamnose reductase [Marinicauda algicola]|uniref:dTDP-4-dehydrorhamnose reductase n=1 Tax=Marinicauda algicola TaxID=2029849 RepID=A0A4S2H4T1_9PROT|nr:dTDP-4-dehydrorhamnose reductase [Marinicauda algicola]TGY90312.1 dTDP-4-dehydrorhamnose reductase [Marinicauda algicola]